MKYMKFVKPIISIRLTRARILLINSTVWNITFF